MFWTTILVNVGMWMERFLIIIPGLQRRQPFEFSWGSYAPSIVEILLVASTFAFVGMGILLFAKVFPLVPVFDVKEGTRLADTIRVGRRVVPASIRE